MDAFQTDNDCRKYLADLRWKDGVKCPHCQNKEKKIYAYKNDRLYKCTGCNKQFTVTVKTLFDRSHIPLRKWFLAVFLFSSHKKGISSYQLGKDIKVTQSTAWFMLHRIRHSMNHNSEFKKLIGDVVEIDETYVGGKISNKHLSIRKKTKNSSSLIHKTPVLGILARDVSIVTKVIYDVKRTKVVPFIIRNVGLNTTIYTDSSHLYTPLKKVYKHDSVNHGEHEYVRGVVHTNSIEGFWSQLKRGIYGVYHQVSRPYLFRYCDEFEYRYNTRKYKETERFNMLLVKCFETRLLFSTLVQTKMNDIKKS
ncbi:MAG: hypothetical protein JWO58_153 [Chitinophagaceae bacterium]|nr:hypothetical protein [Chitinophagaceae bacterium]